MSSVEGAERFGENFERLETSDKIGLCGEFAEEIYGREDYTPPLIFEVKAESGRKRFMAIWEFVQGLPSNLALLPKWTMDDLFLREQDTIQVRSVSLPQVPYVKIQ